MKASAETDHVGGPNLAAEAFKAGLVDEFQLFVAPVMVGGGKRTLQQVRLDLDLVDERRFGNGMVYLRYRRNLTTHMATEQIDTPSGPASVHLHPAKQGEGALVLGHGAGAGIEHSTSSQPRRPGWTRDSRGLVEQPYRVAGRRSPAGAKQLDEAWIAVIEHLRANELAGLPLITGGRSLGARVACRTVETTGAMAVLCLAFPLVPPRRGDKPPQSRLPELEAVDVPVLVVQGESDRFGMPPEGRAQVVKVRGDHGLKADSEAIAAAIRGWLPALAL